MQGTMVEQDKKKSTGDDCLLLDNLNLCLSSQMDDETLLNRTYGDKNMGVKPKQKQLYATEQLFVCWDYWGNLINLFVKICSCKHHVCCCKYYKGSLNNGKKHWEN